MTSKVGRGLLTLLFRVSLGVLLNTLLRRGTSAKESSQDLKRDQLEKKKEQAHLFEVTGTGN